MHCWTKTSGCRNSPPRVTPGWVRMTSGLPSGASASQSGLWAHAPDRVHNEADQGRSDHCGWALHLGLARSAAASAGSWVPSVGGQALSGSQDSDGEHPTPPKAQPFLPLSLRVGLPGDVSERKGALKGGGDAGRRIKDPPGTGRRESRGWCLRDFATRLPPPLAKAPAAAPSHPAARAPPRRGPGSAGPAVPEAGGRGDQPQHLCLRARPHPDSPSGRTA